MKIVVTGSTGMIGSALVSALRRDGHEVVGVSRRPARDTITWDLDAGTVDRAGFEGADAIVHLAGESIQGRWTKAKKQRLVASRVVSTRLIAEVIASLDAPPQVFVCGSAMGYYGNAGDTWVDEQAPQGSTFLADLVGQWEGAAGPARDAGVRLNFARTSLVLDSDDGALPRMRMITRLLLGGPLGPGTQYWSWITLDDQVRALRHLIDSEIEGPVNLATPNPVTQREFAKTLGRVFRRPALLPAPSFAIRLALGEMGQGLLLDSARLDVAKLVESGFEFGHAELEPALRSL